MNILGFDFGTRKIGVAVGQSITATASPLVTLRVKNGHPDWEGISNLIKIWLPDALVVGIPYDLDATENAWVSKVYRFIRQLEGRFKLPVFQANECLTSMEARSIMGRAATSHEVVDAVAASLIVETWLSERH